MSNKQFLCYQYAKGLDSALADYRRRTGLPDPPKIVVHPNNMPATLNDLERLGLAIETRTNSGCLKFDLWLESPKPSAPTAISPAQYGFTYE